MKRQLLLALGLVAGGALAQPACPVTGRELPASALYGQWEARIEGIPGIARVQLARHPDYEGVRGTITRENGPKPPSVGQLAGDIDDEGLLNIDESADGHAISGNWLGELQPGSCGKEFRGTWRNASDDSTHPFVLNKTGSWQ
ncbi:hypothetical protein H4CHR_05422 [Variovorax sp. PBS-H4]|uniref:hypothetical protein n=1 Tax=Variovorax sp. PBS-H4 TaxID=434008 RepID=UPI00131722F7|nr:hypothetical protein [Variovorax sp. PBS-H4]VTU40694.1 hypothetical protein H4CHR_05422 [Variovorax sp. PBS-H4]